MTRHHNQDSLQALILANCSILFIPWTLTEVSNQKPWTAAHNSSNRWALPTQHQRITQTTQTTMLLHLPTLLQTIADLRHLMNPDYPPLAIMTCSKSKHSKPATFTVVITTIRDHSSSNNSHWPIPIHLFPLQMLFQCFETEWHSHHPPPCTTIRKLDRNSEWSHSCWSKPTIQ